MADCFKCCKVDKYFCKCSGLKTERVECVREVRERIIEICLKDLKITEDESQKVLVSLSSSLKENIRTHNQQMLVNYRLDHFSKFRIANSGIQKNSEIFRESNQKLKYIEEKQKIIKSFVKFLYENNDRTKNKNLLTKFMY